MDARQRETWSWRIAVIGLVIAVIGLPTVIAWYLVAFRGLTPIKAVHCERLFDKAHALSDDQSTLAAPPAAGVNFTPSIDLPGRVDLTLTWINRVDVTQTAIAIEGVYGQPSVGDGFIDHRQPSATAGECWNWYHYEPRDDAQPRTVRIQVGGLWPGQNYCFYTIFRVATGYSKPSAIQCLKSTWKSGWGSPAQVP